MIVSETITNFDVRPVLRRTGMRLKCDDCERCYPPMNRPHIPTDGNDWYEQYHRLELMAKHKFVERLRGSLRVDLCPACARKAD